MIRTLIEVTAENDWDHASQLKATLDKLGYEPKQSEEHGRFMAELMQELRERELDPHKLVEDRRAKREAEYQRLNFGKLD